MAAKTTDRMTKEGEKLMRELETLKRTQVRVGFRQGEAQEENGVEIVDVAMWNELGTSSTPSRPFMRDSVDKHIDAIQDFCMKQGKQVVEGKITAQQCLNAIGVYQEGLVQTEIRDGEFEPNAPSTIKKKGSDHPLIDTGTMRQSVSYVITDKKK